MSDDIGQHLDIFKNRAKSRWEILRKMLRNWNWKILIRKMPRSCICNEGLLGNLMRTVPSALRGQSLIHINILDKVDGCFIKTGEAACPEELLAQCHLFMKLRKVSSTSWVNTAPRRDTTLRVQGGFSAPRDPCFLVPLCSASVSNCIQQS